MVVYAICIWSYIYLYKCIDKKEFYNGIFSDNFIESDSEQSSFPIVKP